jgi:hypothetical protein
MPPSAMQATANATSARNLLCAQLVERPVLKPHVSFDVTRIAGGGEFFDLGLVKAHGITPSWTDFKREDFDVAVLGAVDGPHMG